MLPRPALKPGARAGVTELDMACKQLMKTGLFESCNYRYSPTAQSAIDVEVAVRELPAPQRVRFAISGVDEKQLWAWLHKNEPLVKDHMPANDDAVAFYSDAVRRFLKAEGRDKDMVSSVETDLRAQEQRFVFHPKDLPAIVDVAFSGASSISPPRLREAFMAGSKGTGFTEFDVRRVLDRNVRPLFENEGRLGVQFPAVRAEKVNGGVLVTVAVNEGPAFKLRTVKLAGEVKLSASFTIGEVANWNKVEAGAEELRQALKNQGYLNASYSIERQLNNDETADVTIKFERGPLFTFGRLVLEGLDGVVERQLRSKWMLGKASR